MRREIIPITATCLVDREMSGFAHTPVQWLCQQMRSHALKYLLAHDDHGVIWGRLDGDELITSHEVEPHYSPALLHAETLQMARVFAPTGELLVWRDETGEWTNRLIVEEMQDTPAEWVAAFDEQQILWGTHAKPLERGFTLMSDGAQGLFHVVPLSLSGQFDEQNRPLRLTVRHYVKMDEDGFMRVNASRLLTISTVLKESNT